MKLKAFDSRFSAITKERDLALLRRTFAVALEGRRSGNTPFGALLVDQQGNILLEQANIELTEHDSTGHAETTLVRRASIEGTWDGETTIYTMAQGASNVSEPNADLVPADIIAMFADVKAKGDNSKAPARHSGAKDRNHGR